MVDFCLTCLSWEVWCVFFFFPSLGGVCVGMLSHVWFFWDSIDCSPPGFFVLGILQARILEWVDISFSRGYSWPRDQTCISGIACIGMQIFFLPLVPPGKPNNISNLNKLKILDKILIKLKMLEEDLIYHIEVKLFSSRSLSKLKNINGNALTTQGCLGNTDCECLTSF